MANRFDAAARLAEGRPAVDDVEEYVAACRRLGYQHRDLTRYAGQVRDWYGSEDGLDLRALDGDCAALSAAAAATEDVTRSQADLAAELSAVWSGRGGAAATGFSWRSGRAATAVSETVRAAADAAATLRDELWRAVDTKVEAVQAIDGRQQAQRAEWLAAVRTVTTGAGDVAAASELVDQQVKPFVANDIGSDWVAAMHAAAASISAAYDAAIGGLSLRPTAVFGVPGELGARFGSSPPESAGDATAPGIATAPAAAVVPAPAMVSTPGGVELPVSSALSSAPSSPTGPAVASPLVEPPASAPITSPAGAPALSSMPSMPSLGELGGGTSALGGGLSGFGQQLADLIGGLVGSADGGLTGPEDIDGLDEPTDLEDPDDPDDPEREGADETKPDPLPDDGSAEGQDTAEEAEPVSEPEPAAAPVLPPSPSNEPPAPQAVPEAVAETAEQSPCEIAADELPQVGE